MIYDKCCGQTTNSKQCCPSLLQQHESWCCFSATTQAIDNAKTRPSGICKQHTSNAHLLLVACIKSVRGSYDHVKEPHTINQRRLHVVVEVTSWQSCCLQGGEACHLLRVLFGNSDLQPYKHKKSFAQYPTIAYAWQQRLFVRQCTKLNQWGQLT